MSAKVRGAVVLAAGLGKRMQPLTLKRPKPLVEVAGKPLIDYALERLAQQSCEKIIVNTHYLAPMLEDYLLSKTLPIEISREEVLLETGGGIKQAQKLLWDAPFFSLNSDTIVVDIKDEMPALERMSSEWQSADLDILLLLHPKEKAVGYGGAGDFFWDRKTLLRRGDAAAAPYVFTGVQMLHPRIFSGTPESAFSMNLIYDRYLESPTLQPKIGALVHSGEWLHVGDPSAIALAEAALP